MQNQLFVFQYHYGFAVTYIEKYISRIMVEASGLKQI